MHRGEAGREARPQAAGETENVSMKQSEARTSAHPFDRAFSIFFFLPQSVSRRRCCGVVVLQSYGVGVAGEGSRYTDCSLGKENWARGPGACWKLVLVYMGSLAGGC